MNGPSGAVIRIAAKQAVQNPGGRDGCGTYVVVTQDIPDNRLCKNAQAIIGKRLNIREVGATDILNLG